MIEEAEIAVASVKVVLGKDGEREAGGEQIL